MNILIRKTHRWLSIAAAIPLLLILVTGLFLNLSPKITLLQPNPPTSKNASVQISFEDIFRISSAIAEAEIKSWSDITQIEMRPKLGVIRVRSKNYWEIQLDSSTGEILSSARRWKTIFVIIHSGDWFGEWARYGVFFPTALASVFLTLTGILLFFIPYLNKRKSQ